MKTQPSTIPLRYVLTPVERTGFETSQVLSVYRDHGVVPKNSRSDNYNKTPTDLSRYQLVQAGDLVVNKMKAWQGSLGVSDHEGIVSPDYLVCEIGGQVHPPYLHHLLRSAPIIGDFKSRSKGIRPAQWRLYWDDLAQVRIDLPLLEEQRRIAEFLDAETIRIDRVLELRSELAARLIERDNALRDGLLDRLFESTDTIPLRRFITRIEQGDSPQCEAVPRQTSTEWGILKLSSVRHGQFDPDENKRLPDHLRPNRSYSVGHGDFLVTRANTPNLVGDVAVVTEGVERLLLPDLIYRVRLTDSVSADFVAQVALGRRTRSLIESVARGTSQSMVKLRGEDIKTWPIPSATKDQQDKFVSIIAHRTAASARLRSLVDRQAKLLAERRQALITAAVTGQFDVSAASGRNVTEGVSA